MTIKNRFDFELTEKTFNRFLAILHRIKKERIINKTDLARDCLLMGLHVLEKSQDEEQGALI